MVVALEWYFGVLIFLAAAIAAIFILMTFFFGLGDWFGWDKEDQRRAVQEALAGIDVQAIKDAKTIVFQKLDAATERDEILALHDLHNQLEATIEFLDGQVTKQNR